MRKATDFDFFFLFCFVLYDLRAENGTWTDREQSTRCNRDLFVDKREERQEENQKWEESKECVDLSWKMWHLTETCWTSLEDSPMMPLQKKIQRVKNVGAQPNLLFASVAWGEQGEE